MNNLRSNVVDDPLDCSSRNRNRKRMRTNHDNHSEEKEKEKRHSHREEDHSSHSRSRDRSYYGPSSSSSSSSSMQPPPKPEPEIQPPQKPNFGLSGVLSKDIAQHGGDIIYKGVRLKFREPPEALAPQSTSAWRLYVYKKQSQQEEDPLEILHVSKQSAYLFGRDTRVCDIVLHHASISMQHAVLQYRAVSLQSSQVGKVVHPYLMDLDSTNKTYLNGVELDAARYYQLKSGDVLQLGASTREYVLLHT